MTTSSTNPTPVPEPFPIFRLAHRYLLYDPNTIAYVREKYNICGVLIGGLPQAPQQNVFLGIPLELMPEEARLLVEKGVGFVEDDVKVHKQGFLHDSQNGGLASDERKAYQDALRKQGQAAAHQASKRTDDRKKAALQKKVAGGDWNDIPEDMLTPSSRPSSRASKKKVKSVKDDNLANSVPVSTPVPQSNGEDATPNDDDDVLFARSTTSATMPPEFPTTTPNPGTAGPDPYTVTPTASYPPLRTAPSASEHAGAVGPLPEVPASYPLYKHMHSHDYFLTPGLRFGCQYTAYPGDPLRFHSHFLCNGLDWDQEFDLLDLVGGGRLGTGVKKGFLIGGAERTKDRGDVKTEDEVCDAGDVRTFCIEWGGM